MIQMLFKAVAEKISERGFPVANCSIRGLG